MKSVFLLGIVCALLLAPFNVMAETVDIVRGQILEVKSQETKPDLISNRPVINQRLEAEIIEGPQSGKRIELDNDYQPFKKGDKLYIRHIVYEGVTENYAIEDSYRLESLYLFLVLFIVVVLLFGGIQGVRGLLSLVGSMILIVYVLLPQLFQGHSPILVSTAVSALIVILGSYITHGFNKTTTSAVIGMIITLAVVAGLAYYAVGAAKLSGFEAEESIYLSLDTKGGIDMQGLLLGGIMIGLLGILYDVAIGQAVAIEELSQVGYRLSRKEVYIRGLRMGREHIGALVNTLAIAYVGASLPLFLLLFYSYNQPAHLIVNSEIFATEIIRILIGSIGVVLAVPITTLIAVLRLPALSENVVH